MRRRPLPVLVLLLLAFAPTPVAFAEEVLPMKLPPPQTEGGKPLMQALRERRSTREFSPEKLPVQTLSNLLWAAAGINRPGEGKRTAPSARNWQEIDVYVAMADGLFLYDPKAHALLPVAKTDLRAATGMQDYVGTAPVNLVYVADTSRLPALSAEDTVMYTAADAAFMAENAYLFAASAGLAAVVRGAVDREALKKAMGLKAEQRVVLCQTMGMPKK